MYKNKYPLIAVIDSGVSCNHNFRGCVIGGASIRQSHENGGIEVVHNDYEDTLGHGTAVIDAIQQACPDSYFYPIKIFTESLDTTLETLIAAIEHAINRGDIDIIHISAGVTYIEDYAKLSQKLDIAFDSDILIVSAFDNDGAISYPAAYPQVVGVDTYSAGKEKDALLLVENSPIDVFASNHFYRLKWVSPPEIIIQGSSFSVCSITGLAAHYVFNEGHRMNKARFMELLRKDQRVSQVITGIKQEKTWEKGIAFVKKIKKAIVFPFNKEIHSLIAFKTALPFELIGVYDVKQRGDVGKNIKDVLKHLPDNDMKIQNIENLDWRSDFNTLICGHCKELNQSLGTNFFDTVVRKAVKYGKNLYSFDRISSPYDEIYRTLNDCSHFTPEILPADIPQNRFGRLRNRATPIVGVFGTSSVQGKFTVQMELRKRFLRDGHKITQISTEPHGYLFGFDGCYPFGYESTVDVTGNDAVVVLNEMIWDATDVKGSDILLLGGQSGAIAYDYGNIASYPLNQYVFLTATTPDAYILCINPYDEIDYIQRTISYLQSFQGARVTAALLYPITLNSSKLGYGLSRKKLPDSKAEKIRTAFSDTLSIPVGLIGNQKDMEVAYQSILEELKVG